MVSRFGCLHCIARCQPGHGRTGAESPPSPKPAVAAKSGTWPSAERCPRLSRCLTPRPDLHSIRNQPDSQFPWRPGPGAGQTIAIVDEYNDPDILSDLNGFDKAMHVTTNASPTFYQRYGPASAILTVYNQYGKNITRDIAESGNQKKGVPTVPPSDGFDWQSEETIDVEVCACHRSGGEDRLDRVQRHR